jgi:hypothetical protein
MTGSRYGNRALSNPQKKFALSCNDFVACCVVEAVAQSVPAPPEGPRLPPTFRGRGPDRLGTIPTCWRRLSGGVLLDSGAAPRDPGPLPSDSSRVSHAASAGERGNGFRGCHENVSKHIKERSMHWRGQGESENDLQAHRRPGSFRLAVLALVAFVLWRKKRDQRGI